MATERTTSRSGARRRILVLGASALLIAAGAAVTSSTASSAAVPGVRQDPLPTSSSPEGDGANAPSQVEVAHGPGADAEAPYLASHRGALLNDPRGAAWDFAEMRDAGFAWVALNVGDHEPRRWSDVRRVPPPPASRSSPGHGSAIPISTRRARTAWRKLGTLLDTAEAWGTTRPIVNVETELKPRHLGGLITPEDVARELERTGMDEAAVSTEAWLYDMSWLPLTRYPVLLQILPRDNRWAPGEVLGQQAACEKRARGYGFDHVGTSVQTYPMADGTDPEPEWFDLRGTNRSVIWGDNVAASGSGNWQRWVG